MPPIYAAAITASLLSRHLQRIRSDIRKGDLAIVYRGKPSAEVVCEVVVSTDPYVADGKPVFDVEPVRRFVPPVSLLRLRDCPELKTMEFLRNPQVSISPLTSEQYEAIIELAGQTVPPPEEYTHDQIQWYLIAIGLANDCSVWVAPDCRKHTWEGEVFGKKCLSELPKLGLDEETVSLIQNIDVLWLHRNRIVGAFEIEHTTTVYSALLRFADLVALQPNTRIDSYVVAPASRRSKVIAEINRPAFSRFSPPLGDICRFISYDRLAEVYETAKKWGGSLRVDIKIIADDCRHSIGH